VTFCEKVDNPWEFEEIDLLNEVLSMNQKHFWWLGAYFLLDGLLTLFFGRKYVSIFRFGRQENLYRRMITPLLNIPAWQLRGAGLTEAILGLLAMAWGHHIPQRTSFWQACLLLHSRLPASI